MRQFQQTIILERWPTIHIHRVTLKKYNTRLMYVKQERNINWTEREFMVLRGEIIILCPYSVWLFSSIVLPRLGLYVYCYKQYSKWDQ